MQEWGVEPSGKYTLHPGTHPSDPTVSVGVLWKATWPEGRRAAVGGAVDMASLPPTGSYGPRNRVPRIGCESNAARSHKAVCSPMDAPAGSVTEVNAVHPKNAQFPDAKITEGDTQCELWTRQLGRPLTPRIHRQRLVAGSHRWKSPQASPQRPTQCTG